VKVSICQINPTVGDLEGNCLKILHHYRKACADGADIAVFPELAICGYSPEDLVLRHSFQEAVIAAAEELAKHTAEETTAIICGGLWREGEKLYNALLFLEGGVIKHICYKWALPNYGVFDEVRVFSPGQLPEVIPYQNYRLGLVVCEDMWRTEVTTALAQQNPDLVISINASPYEVRKRHMRTKAAEACTNATGAPLLYVNQVGGQDELVFDGNSFFMNADGEIVHNLQGFIEHSEMLELQPSQQGLAPENNTFTTFPGTLETIYSAMVLGLRDYVNKNCFKGVVLGLSGGIDSALSVAVAVDALGAERVRGVFMPSQYTSHESLEDATESAKLLGIKLDSISIEPVVNGAMGSLSNIFAGTESDTTEENIQSRARAIIIMAISNKFGHMLLTTGNKSEMSVGYATLYGDLCGGYSVLKDVYKTTVYELSNWRNLNIPTISACNLRMVIPEHSITRAPTAELKANQTDQDTLPPYEILDAILRQLIDEQQSPQQIIANGFDSATVNRVAKMVYTAEYKRRQAPPGVKITNMAFGRDRRYPITNGFRG